MRIYDYRCNGCGRHHSYDHEANKAPTCQHEDCKGGKMEIEKFGFACKNCGKLIHEQHAGEEKVPYSCPNCGAGIHIGYDPMRFHETMESMIPKGRQLSNAEIKALSMKLHEKIAALPTERKHFPDNFVVLVECDDEQLKGYGLTREQVVKHSPCPKPDKAQPPQNVIRGATEGMAGVDAGQGSINKG
jgi:predicted nucleic acid-binding Zn ribbon protein